MKSCFCFVVLFCAVSAHDQIEPVRPHRYSYEGVGFASYGEPVQSFGGYNGRMPVFGYGLETRPTKFRPKRDAASATKRDAETSVVEAVSQLLYRNDTMCLGLAVCQDARDDLKSASLLKEAFSATDFLRGVNFVQYAVAQANFPQETCEQAFQPCDTITPTLQKALIDVKNSMEPLSPSL